MDSSPPASCSASLLDMPAGCKLKVEELVGSPSVRSKLYAMGILPGTEVEVSRQACGKGSVCIRVRQCSLVLGEGMAKCIFCRTLDGEDVHRRHHHGRWSWCKKHHDCPEGRDGGRPGYCHRENTEDTPVQ